MDKITDIDTAAAWVDSLLNGFTEPIDRDGRAKAEELVRVVMNLYGTGLANIIKIVRESSDGEQLLEHLAEDKLVASLLLVHGLHPVDPGTRIRRALTDVEQRLDGYHFVLLGLADSTAKIRVEPANGISQRRHAAGLSARIEQALREAAPDVERFEIEGIADPTGPVQNARA
jgi:hypothetical protein